jgi:hypothetical protein
LPPGLWPEPQPPRRATSRPRRATSRRPRRITITLRRHITIGRVVTLLSSATTLRPLNVPTNDETERPGVIQSPTPTSTGPLPAAGALGWLRSIYRNPPSDSE